MLFEWRTRSCLGAAGRCWWWGTDPAGSTGGTDRDKNQSQCCRSSRSHYCWACVRNETPRGHQNSSLLAGLNPVLILLHSSHTHHRFTLTYTLTWHRSGLARSLTASRRSRQACGPAPRHPTPSSHLCLPSPAAKGIALRPPRRYPRRALRRFAATAQSAK